MAYEGKFRAIASVSGPLIPLVRWNLFHLCLCHGGVVVIFTKRAATTAGFSLIALHRLTQCCPIFRVCTALIAGLFRAKHPIIDYDLRVLLVFSGCDERFALAETVEAFDHEHGLFHYPISLPDARMLIAEAVPASVEMKPPFAMTWPTNSGKV